MWGKRNTFCNFTKSTRDIPTCVGKTRTGFSFRRRAGRHPHVCGENKAKAKAKAAERETSPRVWGKHVDSDIWALAIGDIPTCVGKNHNGDSGLHELQRHPHVCGENFGNKRCVALMLETSPRVWGKLSLAQAVMEYLRDIPTCVGKTERYE